MRNCNEMNTIDVSNPTPRSPIVFLLDTSSGMEGASIHELNEGLKQFLRDIAADEAASRSVELEVITFDSTANVVMPFATIEDADRNLPSLAASSSPSIDSAVEDGISLAVRDLMNRRRMLRENGISAYRPWIILMMDGGPNGEKWKRTDEKIHAHDEWGKFRFFGFEVASADARSKFCAQNFHSLINLFDLNNSRSKERLFHRSTAPVFPGGETIKRMADVPDDIDSWEEL